MIEGSKIALDLSGALKQGGEREVRWLKWAWSQNSIRDYLYPVSLICLYRKGRSLKNIFVGAKLLRFDQ